MQQRSALGPVAEPRIGVDVALVAIVDEGRTPGSCELLRARKRAIRIVVAAQKLAGKWQALQDDGCPAFERGAEFFALGIPRRHQQCADHAVGVARVLGPGGGQQAAQAVGSKNDGAGRGGQYRFFQLHHPVATQGLHPVVLLHALVAIQRFPATLPMVGARVLPAGQEEDGGGSGLSRHGAFVKQLLLFR